MGVWGEHRSPTKEIESRRLILLKICIKGQIDIATFFCGQYAAELSSGIILDLLLL